ncbi:MAG: hypothetical protein JW861_03925 [Bacteroidales bacterium]|nr:hypothetical protein [Bacteroidales bacterium]
MDAGTILSGIEEQVRKISNLYRTLKQRLEEQDKVIWEQGKVIEEQKETIKQLKEHINVIQVAKSLGYNMDKQQLRGVIDELVREIDKSIRLIQD